MRVLRKSQVHSARGAVNHITYKASGMLPVDDSRMVSGVLLTKRSVRDERIETITESVSENDEQG